jgi:hypothetical protein
MPTLYNTSNAALQYDEPNDMLAYIVNDTSVTGIKFLTEAPLTRQLHANELSALYFLSNDTSFTGFAQYTYYDADGNTPMQTNVQLYPNLIKYHNAIPVNWIGADPTAVKMRVRLIRSTSVAITEERYFILDNTGCETNQLTWLNKLGGFDSWVFTGGLETTITQSKENEIENPFNTNFSTPYAITSYRSINSSKQLKVAHRCENNETAEWLKTELINAAEVYIVENEIYKPVLIQNAQINYSSYQKNFIVSFNLKFAYPINIQTR